MIDEELLARLMTTEATSGDEDRLAGFLADDIAANVPGTLAQRIGNTLIVSKGRPRVAVFAHIDSVGFTLGYDNELIPIGGPDPENGTPIRCTVEGTVYRAKIKVGGSRRKHDSEFSLVNGEGPPGTAWVYDTPPELTGSRLTGAYLDNRFGTYTGLHLLRETEDILVAFTAAEEISGRGAADAGRWIYEHTSIRQALIADITWATAHVVPGQGPAVSLRDAFVSRSTYFNRVRRIAERSGVPFQIEIQSGGSSDGGTLERAGFGIDWVFVGAAENGYHSGNEFLARDDAQNMLRLYTELVGELSEQEA
jgi:putative aminopeptidase FrvX